MSANHLLWIALALPIVVTVGVLLFVAAEISSERVSGSPSKRRGSRARRGADRGVVSART